MAVLDLCCCSGFSLVVESRGDTSCGAQASLHWLPLLWNTGFRVCRLQYLQHMGSVAAVSGPQSTGSIVVAHRLSCAVAHGIFPDQGSNPCLLHWQADSLPLSHQGSPQTNFYFHSFPCTFTNLDIITLF